MTKLVDWSRFSKMTSKERSGISTASTFSEVREKEERPKKEKAFGLEKMEEEINIEWPNDADKTE